MIFLILQSNLELKEHSKCLNLFGHFTIERANFSLSSFEKTAIGIKKFSKTQ